MQAIRNAEMNLLIGTKLVNVLYTVLDYLYYETEYNCSSTIKDSFALLWTRIICPIVDFLQLDFYSDLAGTYKPL